MDVKYQVFVSSTFIDLQDERRAAIEAILNMGHIPVGMEAFQASDDTQWDYIKRRIDESDYYIVIVGERYGSEQDGKSYTQMEYEYAVSQGVPVAGFLLDPVTRRSWPSDKVEYEKKDKVESFRSLCQQKLVKFWKNPDELAGRVAMALNELMRDRPRTGWVRADSVPSIKVLEEISRLSEERRELQEEVERLSTKEEKLVIPAEARWKIKELSTTSIGEICRAKSCPIDSDTTLLEFIISVAPQLTSGEAVWSFQYSAWQYIAGATKDSTNTDNYSDVLKEIFSRLILLDIVEEFAVQRYSFDKPSTTDIYRLTDTGKKIIMYVNIMQSEETDTSE